MRLDNKHENACLSSGCGSRCFVDNCWPLPIYNDIFIAFFKIFIAIYLAMSPPFCKSIDFRMPTLENVDLIVTWINAIGEQNLASSWILESRSWVISRKSFKIDLLKESLSSIGTPWSSSIKIALLQRTSRMKSLIREFSLRINFSFSNHMYYFDR